MPSLMGEATQPVPRSHPALPKHKSGAGSPAWHHRSFLLRAAPASSFKADGNTICKNISAPKRFSNTAKEIFVLWGLSTATCMLLCKISFREELLCQQNRCSLTGKAAKPDPSPELIAYYLPTRHPGAVHVFLLGLIQYKYPFQRFVRVLQEKYRIMEH